MAIILNIDTAAESATISLSEKTNVIDFITNANQKGHASFLQPAIKSLLLKNDIRINNVNAISVTEGPGSYTGLRVGMASAKGLCYALKIPLLTISTLEVMAFSCIKQIQVQTALYCPMIDARRMEVFTALYDHHLAELIKPCSMILDNESFKDLLATNKIYFSGSGVFKLKEILDTNNAIFDDNEISPTAMAELSYANYVNNNFANLAYASPVYLKDFYTPLKLP